MCDEKDVRQWIAEGKILAPDSSEDFDIVESDVLDFLIDLSNVRIAYDKGIDDQTEIERLMVDVKGLQQEVNKYDGLGVGEAAGVGECSDGKSWKVAIG